ncbi:hypothetical protein C4D60_Mb00t05670 [Musa balbisiana]|uniref:Uncharacterized protein n=1 Tax=Musa balbisiana TaxID=52838 RepID=A0A4S8I456_MUSBA|nr:hypothetical protein C4D60_Mb00t05350 [Musa balbisiana]THU42074.1 hypothetical protein C4D60_Mb00t05430 [Musa balbisiana]THU42078.1 hypothetical protein C4D60_Mb00t05470 [Musa balbisiana]THU42087.1 hypothetical protein C4D60_Mb00t05620 [Musa balbisiana]THU42089.1 hypothetical protein C4D60_Mb00t05640 [Musa balbisiana]
MSRRARRSPQNPGREPGRSGRRDGGSPSESVSPRELRKGIGLKFPSRDAAADGNVRKSGDAGGGPGKSYLFCLTARPPWKRLSRSGRKSAARRAASGAPPAALENPEDRVPPAPGRTHNRIRSPR